MNLDWQDRAACRGSSLDFYAVSDEDGATISRSALDQLVRVCASCPVARECATYAMRKDGYEQYGVWAGSLPLRRSTLHRLPVDEAVDVLMSDLRVHLEGANYRRAHGHGKSQTPIRADFKHGVHGYKNRRCQCEICAGAWREYQARKRGA